MGEGLHKYLTKYVIKRFKVMAFDMVMQIIIYNRSAKMIILLQ